MMEICIDSIESGINAAKGGAKRLEVCSSLTDGGLTPTPGLIKSLSEVVSIPMFAMVRIRGGNFVYTKEEVDGMIYDLKLLKTMKGIEGFVFGALTAENKIDQDINRQIIEAASPLPVTFHRAFDEVNSNPHLTARLVAQLGFKRILTSGLKNSAEEGLELIKSLASAAPTGLTIIPGAGINPNNIKKIKDESNCVEFHASARIKQFKMGTKNKIGSMEIDSTFVMVTDQNIVRQMVIIVDRN